MTSAPDPDIERLRRAYEFFNAQQFESLTDLLAPDIVLVRDGGQPPLRGRDEFIAFMEPDAFEYQRFGDLRFERSGDKIVVTARVRAKGAGSEIELDMQAFHVFTIADGVATRMVATFDEEKARAEAGLLSNRD